MGRRRHPWWSAWASVALLVGLAGLATVRAEDEADGPSPLAERVERALAMDARASLEPLFALQRELEAAGTERRSLRCRVEEALARRQMALGNPFASLAHWETLVRVRKGRSDKIGHARALIETARANLASGTATAAGVVPYLVDARAAIEGLDANDASGTVDPAIEGALLRIRAETRYYQGDLEGALEELDGHDLAALPEPHRAATLDLLAQTQWRLGAYVEAAGAYLAAGRRRAAATAWARAGRGDEALALYTELLQGTPEDVGLLWEAVSAARFTRRAAELAAVLEAIEVDATVAVEHLLARARLIEDTGDLAAARALLTAAAELDDASAEPLVQLGRLHLGGPEPDIAAAAEALEEALRRSPEDERAVAGLWHIAGLDYRELWRTAAAGPTFARTLRVQRALVAAAPDDATAWANLANTLRVGGQTAEALEAYERAMEENPYDPGIVSDWGLALAAAGRPDEALAAYLRSVELDPGHLAGRQNAARALWKAGRYREADAQLQPALRTARALGRSRMTYRFLMDRVTRSRHAAAGR